MVLFQQRYKIKPISQTKFTKQLTKIFSGFKLGGHRNLIIPSTNNLKKKKWGKNFLDKKILIQLNAVVLKRGARG